MRTAGLPNFKKLWGKIDKDLPKGEYTVTIENSKFNYFFIDIKNK